MTTLGDRIKSYEQIYDSVLLPRVPIIIRLDGKGFSKLTKAVGAKKPFDDVFSKSMADAMLKTASKIEGCVFGFTQSDEVSFILMNDQSIESQPWFGNRVQKICSVVASMMSVHFNSVQYNRSAYFDARVFAVPNVQEAVNTIIWRQQDCTKNSISCACYYEVAKTKGKGTTRKLMHSLNQNQQQELLFKEAGINWNDYPVKYKRGISCYRVVKTFLNTNPNGGNDCYNRSMWTIDENLPILSSDQKFLFDIVENGNRYEVPSK